MIARAKGPFRAQASYGNITVLARFTKRENGVSITQDFPVFATISFVSFYNEDGKMLQAHVFDVLSVYFGKRE